MDRRTLLVSSVGVLATSASATADQSSFRSRLIGMWSLTEAVSVKGNETVPWFGRHPPITGIIIYDENGWMSVQIAGAPTGTISRADFLKLSAADRAVWLDEYYAYYGTFEVDETAHVVTHHVVSSLLPYETATNLKRNASIDGDVLTLLTPARDEGGKTTFNRLVWKKAT
ncbi:MAG TPA: lipocalin-like domain-containing protein [Bradyrhizobium sp.]|nr:lipocalin-like domain-containing protein [Bradyrhizobium sp.]